MTGSVLIANRREIAVRASRTAHVLDLETVALLTEVDRGAFHIDLADVALEGGSHTAARKLFIDEWPAHARAT